MIDMNKIGNYIKEERKKAGLTQEEFSHSIQKNPELARSEIRNRKKGGRQWKPKL